MPNLKYSSQLIGTFSILIACAFNGKLIAQQERATNPWDTPTSLTLFMATTIAEPDIRATALLEIASLQIEACENELALETLNLAERMADQVEWTPYWSASTYEEIAAAQIRARNRSQAWVTLTNAVKGICISKVASTRSIPDLTFIASAQAKSGDHNSALLTLKYAAALVQSIEDRDEKADALLRIAETLMAAGAKEQALAIFLDSLQMAKRVDHGKASRFAMFLATEHFQREARSAFGPLKSAFTSEEQLLAKEIVEAQVKNTETQESNPSPTAAAHHEVAFPCDTPTNFVLSMAQRIVKPSDRASRLNEIASSQLQAGEIQQSLVTLNKSLEAVELIEDTFWKSLQRKEVIQSLIKAGDIDKALEVVKKIPNRPSMESELANIAKSLARAGDFDKAVRLLQDLNDVESKTGALIDIASVQIDAGFNESAKDLLVQAIVYSRTIKGWYEFPGYRQHVLRNISSSLSDAGFYRQASRVANKIDGETHRALALANIASVNSEYEVDRVAVGIRRSVVSKALKIRDINDRASILISIALAFAKTGDKELVLGTLEKALDAAQNIENRHEKSLVIINIAMTIATEPKLEDNRSNTDGEVIRRIKTTFDHEERQLAKALTESLFKDGEPIHGTIIPK